MVNVKAVQLTGIRELEIQDIAAPGTPQAGQVLVNVQWVGICGSDVHNYVEGGIGARKLIYPFVPGHEASGVVAGVGEGVTHLKVGDHVMIEPAMHCGECDQCCEGRYHTCRKIQFLSSAGELQGCMCEQVIIPAHNAFLAPAGVSDEEVALAEPLSIAIYSVKQSIEMHPDRPIAILGAGPIGLCTLLAAKQLGAERIYISDPITERREMALKMGASAVADPFSDDGLASWHSVQEGGMAAVFECCGQQAALDQAVDMLRPGGKLIVTGIPEGSRISYCIDQLRRKEITIFNVRRQNQCVESALEAIASGEIDVKPLMTHRFDLVDTKRAFEMVASYRDGVVKALIRCC